MDRKERKQWKQALELSALGLMFPIAIALGFLWGWWMDGLFGTWPWLTVIFTGFGVAAAFLNLFRMTAGIGDEGDDGESG
ncbi:MAG: AtpZ/AtpI family protein [Thermoanaerobaculia bacterium]|nr:AtpZ/AtpI family protein [Thermoanaerobaculia bacterium]